MPSSYVIIGHAHVSNLIGNDIVRFHDEAGYGWVKIDSITPKAGNITEVKFDQGDGTLVNRDKKSWAVVEVAKV